MSANGLDVLDKTLQTTRIWLDELVTDICPDAWLALGAIGPWLWTGLSRSSTKETDPCNRMI